MANFTYHVQDANSGASIQGAAIYDTISTSCCNCWPSGCSGCNGCTSGNGFSITGNTDSNGNYSDSTVYTCPMAHDVLVTANGYNDTHVQVETGNITGDAGVASPGSNAIQMVPKAYVPQSNQGGAGAAQYAAGAAAATNPAPNPGTTSGLETYAIIGIVAVVLVVVVVLVLSHRGA